MLVVFLFTSLLLVGAPIAIATGMTTVYAMWQNGINITVASQKMFSGIDSFSLMAIPFFIFAGDIMLAGGTSKRLIALAEKSIGWITGGLPIAGIVSAMFFAALSGSSPATVAAIGGIMIPSLIKANYSKNFSVGLMCAAGSLGIIIPPSITMLVYGVTSEESISDLFIAGIIPGILVGVALMLASFIIAKKQKYVPQKRESMKGIFLAAKDAVWGIIMPLIVLGGIYAGIFTPTEAAAVAIVYSLFISFFVYKELDLKKLVKVARKSIIVSSMVMFVISTAKLFGWYLTFQKIPTTIANIIIEHATNGVMVLILINILLLIVGMVMDPSAAVLILAPLFLPVVKNFGISPIHFGVIMIVNLSIGMLTPPFGLNLFVASGISNTSMTDVTKGTMPFIFVLIIALLVITFVPQLSLYLPSLLR